MDLQQLLNKWKIKCDVNTLLAMWNESHRHYHNLDHLNDLINQINENKSKYSQKEYEKLIIASLFHDCIYDPMSNDNEEKSADFFESCVVDKSDKDIQEIKQIIIDTKTHQATISLSEEFNRLDMSIVESDFDKLLKWENGINLEFVPVYGFKEYKIGRIKFLENLLDKYPNNTFNLLKLINFVKDSEESSWNYFNENKKVVDYYASKNSILVGEKTNLLSDMKNRYDFSFDLDNIHFFDNGYHFATLYKEDRFQILKHDGSLNEYGWRL